MMGISLPNNNYKENALELAGGTHTLLQRVISVNSKSSRTAVVRWWQPPYSRNQGPSAYNSITNLVDNKAARENLRVVLSSNKAAKVTVGNAVRWRQENKRREKMNHLIVLIMPSPISTQQ